MARDRNMTSRSDKPDSKSALRIVLRFAWGHWRRRKGRALLLCAAMLAVVSVGCGGDASEERAPRVQANVTQASGLHSGQQVNARVRNAGSGKPQDLQSFESPKNSDSLVRNSVCTEIEVS